MGYISVLIYYKIVSNKKNIQSVFIILSIILLSLQLFENDFLSLAIFLSKIKSIKIFTDFYFDFFVCFYNKKVSRRRNRPSLRILLSNRKVS